MRSTRIPNGLVLLGLVIGGAAWPAMAGQDGADAGFQPLFNGRDLAGWKLVNTKDNFLIKDGRLVMNRGAGWLATEKPFEDFELRLIYRFVTPGADSGIFIRSGLEGKNWTNRGYQIQNMDNQTLGDVVSMGRKVVEKSHKADLVKTLKKPSGEWNELIIQARGPAVEVRLNGKPVATGTIEAVPGHIGLQAEGGVLEFKAIEIKDLSE